MRITTGRARRAMSLAPALALAIVVAACSTGGAASAPASAVASDAAPPTGSAAALSLDGTTWFLTDYISPDGQSYTVPSAVTPKLAFADGQVSGNAGCNSFNGSYTVTGDAVELGPLVSTKMACEEPMASVEGAFLAALDSVDKVAILEDGKLQLWDDGGKTTLAFIKGS